MTDYTELKRLAEAAKEDWPNSRLMELAEAEVFIDAASPTTIMALIAENERLEREAKNDLIAYKAVLQRQDQLREERDSQQRVAIRTMEERDQLKAEVEALRKDAERYQWLAAHSFDIQGSTQFHVWQHTWEPHSQTGEPTEWKSRVRGPAIARFIDAAMSKEAGQ